MKKLTKFLLIMFVSFILINESSAQKYYATTYKGGNLGVGAIIEYNAATGTISRKASFYDYGFNYAYCDLLYYNYKFYGTVGGGMTSTGALYEYDPFTNVFTVKATFTAATGTEPRGSMVVLNNKFYGMAYAGGANSAGTIYEYDPAANVLTKRYDFIAATGSNPQGALSHYGGFLYGMTRNGGAGNVGVIFQFNPTTFAYSKKYDFTFSGQGGGNPDGSLTLYNNKFYGLTAQGGTGSGILFEFDPATNIFTKKITLNHTIGRRPFGNLTVADSKLYGMTSEADSANYDKGVIFEYNPATNVYTKKHEFDGTGAYPEGSLIYDNNKLIGMTTYGGGPANGGTVFEYDHNTNVLTYKGNMDPSGKEPQGGFTRFPFYPEIDVRGNGVSITDGDVTPDLTDHSDFGTTGINAGNIRRFTIKNSGDAPILFPAFSLTGADAAQYSFVNPPNYIGPGDTNHLYVRFNPTSAGVKNATININAGDPDETPFNFDIKGTAAASERGLTFDGNDAVNIPANPNFNFSTGTVEFWVKPNYPTSSFRYLLANSDASFIRWTIYMNADRQGVTFYNGTTAASFPFNFTQTVWYHLAFVQSGSSLKCYVNGIYAGVQNVSPSGITNKPLAIGNLMTSGFGLIGSMDEVRFWSSQRTQEQIQANMSADVPQQAELLAYYRFDQGIENGNNAGLTTALDYSGNCYKGTLNNFALTGSTSNWTSGAAINSNPIGFPASAVTGNSVAITDGSTIPSLLNHTDFGSTSNPGSISRYFSIQNTGSGNLNISNITISGPDAAAYTATNYFPNTNLSPGQSMSFKVIFSGTSAGLKTATININTNNCDIPVYDFAVQANVFEADRGLTFNGTNNYLIRPYTPAYKFSSGTWEFWIKPSSTLPYDPVIIANRTGNTYCYQITMSGVRNSISFTNNGILQTWNYGFEQSQWYHVALVTNAGITEAFVNGVSLGTKTTGPNTANNMNFSIGRSGSTNPAFNNYFNGSLDDIRIWNVVRTQSQIQANMNTDIPQQAGLVGYYRFDQGIANGNNAGITEALDFSGSCNSMTMNNFDLTGTASNFTNGALPLTNAINFSEIAVRGNYVNIPDGKNTTSGSDYTEFPNTTTGNNSVRIFKIHNSGSAVLNISSVSVTGAGAAAYGTSLSSSNIAANDSATLQITFTPTAAGSFPATVNVNTNDCDEALFDFAINGLGQIPERGLSFDGTNDIVTRPANSLYEFADGSVELWVKPAYNTAPGNPTLVANRSAGGSRWSIHMAGNRTALYFWNGTTSASWSYTFNMNQWYHIAFVESGANLEAFVNGNSLGAQVINSSSSTGLPLVIGSNGAGEYFAGSMDEVRIWNVARTLSQIQSSMSSDVPQQTGLVAYYRFDQGISGGANAGVTQAFDYSGNCLYATLNNFTLNGAASNWVDGSITSSNAINFSEMELRGNGIVILSGDATPTVSDNTDFGSVISGGNITKTFKIHNTGSAPLTITGAILSGPDAGSFTMHSISVSPVPVNDSATFDLEFHPVSAGLKTAVLTIQNTDCDESAYNFAVQGLANQPFTTYNIKLIPEGFYNVSERLNMKDTVRAYLHNSSSPFNVIDSAVAVIDSVTYTGSFIFNNAPNGTYYISLSHRNSLETWSKAGGETFTQGATLYYDFTDVLTKAFGSNMKNVDAVPVRYGIFSGDVNKSSTIDLNDIISVFNSSANFESGYIVNDATGDKIVNLNDLTVVYNNSAAFVSVIKP